MAKEGEPVPLYWGQGENRQQVGTAVVRGDRLELRVDDEQAIAYLTRGTINALSASPTPEACTCDFPAVGHALGCPLRTRQEQGE